MWLHAYKSWNMTTIGNMDKIIPIPIGLDYLSVSKIAKILNIDITPAILSKLQKLETYEIKRMRKEVK